MPLCKAARSLSRILLYVHAALTLPQVSSRAPGSRENCALRDTHLICVSAICMSMFWMCGFTDDWRLCAHIRTHAHQIQQAVYYFIVGLTFFTYIRVVTANPGRPDTLESACMQAGRACNGKEMRMCQKCENCTRTYIYIYTVKDCAIFGMCMYCKYAWIYTCTKR